MGWSETFARDWPIDAVVAENGAVSLIREARRCLSNTPRTTRPREANALRLRAAARRVLLEVPGAVLARDSAGRVTDIAIDHSEFAQLSAQSQIDACAARDATPKGMNASVSSIHINGWYGSHDKLSGATGSCAACMRVSSKANRRSGSTSATRPTIN